jgi:cell wall assembly regulator SMI1
MTGMQFDDPEKALSVSALEQIENDLSLSFPEPVKQRYLESNGGYPSPYVFSSENADTVVSIFLPLASDSKGTAVESYRRLVQSLKLVAPSFFPFAVDGGGDYFFVDCSTPDGRVFFYRGDSRLGDRLVDLKLSFQGFWESLRPE